jgi:hypothetical protein
MLKLHPDKPVKLKEQSKENKTRGKIREDYHCFATMIIVFYLFKIGLLSYFEAKTI